MLTEYQLYRVVCVVCVCGEKEGRGQYLAGN